MSIIKSYAPFQNLSNFQVFTTDEGLNSEYFRITELNTTFTGGKNAFLIEGSPYLKESTDVRIEILDVEGNPVYFEPGDGIPEYYEGTSKVISVHVYDDTPIGPGKITVLGELKHYIGNVGEKLDIPDEWKGIYNVKWEQDIIINKKLNNETIVRFYKRPLVTITEVVKPLFDKTVPTVTQTGNVVGEPQTPSQGQNLTTWTAGTLYKLRTTDGSVWTSSVDENSISIPSLNYTPTIIEVLNETEVLVDTPYTVNNIVQPFTTASYTTTFEDLSNEVTTVSGIDSSFGIIDITRLKTFAGDVARVKIFRKSRNTAGDFQLVQESKLESNELLRDLTTTTETEINYGFFNDFNLDTYWVSSSNDHPVSINNSVLASSVKFDYDNGAGGVQTLRTANDLSITDDSEYTLSFRALLSGSSDSTKSLRAYLSSSTSTQDIINISPTGSDGGLNTRREFSENIISTISGSAKLVFEATGDDWYLSAVSLRNAQDTAFSPDEFTILQDIPRKLEVETFDFRFEFYDINNNYIPVDVVATKEFDGGNDFSTGGGDGGPVLQLGSSQNAFRFLSGSVGNPPFQQIQLTTTANGTSGSITFASSAFDIDGVFINPGSYTGQYPGALTSVTATGGILTIANFSGSDSSFTVGSIIYTASVDALEEYETIFRLEDGTDAPTLIATSNANQFIYEPTTLSPKPSGQSIILRAQRKNLASLVTPITVNSSSDAGTPPPLTFVGTDTSRGIDTYSITALEYSASNATSTFPETTYSFTGSDQFGNLYSDEITLSPVINFDGISLVLSTENTTFRASSDGTVSATEFNEGDGEVEMRIGNNEIPHSNNNAIRNSFDIYEVTASAGTTANSVSPTTNDYGISAMTVDSGSLILRTRYLAGDNATTVELSKKVNYTKARRGAIEPQIFLNPQTQTVTADSELTTFSTPQDIELVIQEAGSTYSYDVAVDDPSEYSITSVVNATNNGDGTITPNTPTDANTLSGSVGFSYRTSESVLVTGQLLNWYVGVNSPGPSGSGGSGSIGEAQGTGQVYYQISTPTAPSTPSATNYTFSTGNFTGLTANWDDSPPIFSGSNGSKYWYSTFLATEDTGGGDVASGANLSFGSPKQAIGFSGLVTFTGTDSVDDGTGNELSFGSGGTTEINGSRIVTGQIDSTNLTTTRGSRYDLDNETIQIGGTLVSQTNGPGIWMDGGAATGTADFMVGDPPSGPFIRFDGGAGTFEISTSQFSVDTGGNAFFGGDITGASGTFTGTVQIGGTDLTSDNTFNSTDVLAAGSVNYNPGITITANDGRPDGILASYSSTTAADVSFLNTSPNQGLKLYSASDSTIGATWPAFRVNPDGTYNIFIRAKSTSANASGFYARIYEYDSELPTGVTHVGNNATTSEGGTANFVEDTRQKAVTVISGTSVENGPITTGYVDYELEYVPTSTAKFASLTVLNWSGMGTTELHIDRAQIKEQTVDKTSGTVGGWNISSTQIQGGSPSGGGDGAFTTQGIQLGSTGYISSENFYIDSLGNAVFAGSLQSATGTFTGAITASAGSIGDWIIESGRIQSIDGDIRMDSDSNSIKIYEEGTDNLAAEFRSGPLTAAGSGNSETVDIGTATSNSTTISGIGAFDEYYYSAFVSTSVGFSGNYVDSSVVWPGVSTLITTNGTFTGFVQVTAGFEVTQAGITKSSYTAMSNSTNNINTSLSLTGYSGNSTFTTNAVGNHGFRSFIRISGFLGGGSITKFARTFNPPSQTWTLQTSLTEFTEEGVQVISGTDEYVTIERSPSFWNLDVRGRTRLDSNTVNAALVVNTTTGNSAIDANGDVDISGALTKGSGTFKIPHPLSHMSSSNYLVHSFTESPRADLIYRGTVSLISGSVQINIDEEVGMTLGTFEVLCRNVQCFTSNETSWDRVRGSVSGSILTIECENGSCSDQIGWMVIGERNDPHMYETEWTDENGYPILEPIIINGTEVIAEEVSGSNAV